MPLARLPAEPDSSRPIAIPALSTHTAPNISNDELPQLINLLQGRMSMVCPMEYRKYYHPILLIPPGKEKY